MQRKETSNTDNSPIIPVLPILDPLIYAELADNAYYPKQNNNLPEGYLLYMECPEEMRWWGYFGKTFYKVNDDTKTIDFVIAHRGTDNSFDIVEDLRLWLEEILPAQYVDSALPFMKKAIKEFERYVAFAYPDYTVNYKVTGHSMGASLAECTMLDSSSGNLKKMQAVLIENPGVPPSVTKNRVNDYFRKNTMLINTRPDSINTLYKTDTPNKFHLEIDNCKYPRMFDAPLPLLPSLIYYAYEYSFGVLHPISGIVNFLKTFGTKELRSIKRWPYGFENGFDIYKNYEKNTPYWNGYIKQLWSNNGIESEVIKVLFNDNFAKFEEFYKYVVLDNTAPAQTKVEAFKALKQPDEIWQKLPPAVRNVFSNNMNNFQGWLKAFYQGNIPQHRPLLSSVQQSVSIALKALLTQPRKSYSDSNAIKYKTLLHMHSELCALKYTPGNLNEATAIAEIFNNALNKSKLSLNDLFEDKLPTVLENIQFDYLIAHKHDALTYVDKEIAKWRTHIYFDFFDKEAITRVILKDVTEKFGLSAQDLFSIPTMLNLFMPTEMATTTISHLQSQTDASNYTAYLSQNSAEHTQSIRHSPALPLQASPLPNTAAISEKDQVALYKAAILEYLSLRLGNDSKIPKGSDKYKSFETIRNEILSQDFATIKSIQYKIAAVKRIAATHRDKTGFKGIFNVFRDTESLLQFNEYFDQQGQIIKIKNSKGYK